MKFCPRNMVNLFSFLVIGLVLGCGADPVDVETDNQRINDEEIEDRWHDDHPAPRGVAALGGDGFVLVRFAPVLWAESHRVEASTDEDFADEFVTLDPEAQGKVVHSGLDIGQTWYYRIVAIADEDRERVSKIVSATTVEHDLLSIYLAMDEGDVTELYERDPQSDDRLPGRLFVGSLEGPEVDIQGLRFRGATTRGYEKKGFNIRLDERPELDDYPDFNFRSEVREAGNRVALNAMWTDPTGLREALNFEMFQHLGLIGPTTYFTDLYINGIFEGLYIGLERVDREAIRRWGLNRSRGEFTMVRDESKGNRHRPEIAGRSIFGQNIDAVVDSDEEAIELFQQVFDYRGEVEDQNWEALLELVRWVRATPAGPTYETEFEERFNVEALIDFLAIHVLTHDRDSLDIDYWLYRDEDEDADDGRWLLIPWDKNLTFGAHYYSSFQGVNDFLDYNRDVLPTMNNALIDKFFATPAFALRFEERILELSTDVFDDQWFEEKIEEYSAQIEVSMARTADTNSYKIHPGQHHGAAGWWREHREALLDFVDLRRSYLFAHYGAEDNLVESGRRIVSEDGRVVADFKPQGEFDGSWSVEIIDASEDEDDWVGIDRIWEVEFSESVSGEMTLYWQNSPWESWYRQLENPGRQWYLDTHFWNEDEEWERIESRVLPFSNKIVFAIEDTATARLRVGY